MAISGYTSCETTPRQSGIALVVVLWVTAMLSIMAVTLLAEQRSEIVVTKNLIESAKAQFAVQAGMQLALHEMSRGVFAGAIQQKRFDDTNLDISVVSESGKVDINFASESLLNSLFEMAGVEDELERARLVDAVLDWRDSDQLRRLHGYEAEDYQVAGFSYGPRDAQFRSIEELALVNGITPQLYHRIANVITIYGGARTYNSEVADTLYRQLSQGGGSESILASGESDPHDPVYHKTALGGVYTIRCAARRESGVSQNAELTIRVLPQRTNSHFLYETLSWRYYEPPSSP